LAAFFIFIWAICYQTMPNMEIVMIYSAYFVYPAPKPATDTFFDSQPIIPSASGTLQAQISLKDGGCFELVPLQEIQPVVTI
jgi:hypothetical protein